MSKTLSKSEVNHLHRLLGWVACEIGQSPNEMVSTVKNIADKLGGEISEDAKGRLVTGYLESTNVPEYVRAAVKQLRKAIKDEVGEIIDADEVQIAIEDKCQC